MEKLMLLLICLCGATYAAVIERPLKEIDFYQLYNVADPEASISLRSKRSTLDRIADHGYPVEHHHIVTEDGYVVGVFRIPYSHKLQNQNEVRPIVLIQHGLMSCSDAWILAGPNDALPYLLADAGYDVWLGNGRGNTYSRNHTTRSTKHPDFWKFSWHEIAYYDIAAMIDYALSTENGLQQKEKSIHYVGHSQGTTVFFALMSTRPEYNEKIRTAHMFAPVAIMKNMENRLVRTLSPYLGYHNVYSSLFGSQEFIPGNGFLLALFFNTCEPDLWARPVCLRAMDSLYGNGRVNITAMPEGMATHPAGCSTNQILHYMQENQSGYFRQFDYGKAKNLKKYGTEQPPDYPVEQITSAVHLWYSDNDVMAAVEDVETIAERMPNVFMHHMEDPLWDHADYALNWEIREFVNEPVIAIMEAYEMELSQV
ncbi:uncharacterized protein Dwil_GK12870 [Drosophila willistoni]|uniref:Lipase n=1 Tax=Drosophila willistoni TaxID=7260 RepID=B4NJA7_DROWI|nr:lipase 3 [Drosophila willistoni]EDW84938.2 uncharacterized protein Dwil_GK12870 [Drosophila willistoni]